MSNNHKINFFSGVIFMLFLAGACTTSTPTATITSTAQSRLSPYLSPSPSTIPGSATPFPTKIAIPTATPWPSPTPFIYTIKAGDTFGGLALRYGATISEIEAANPGIDPNILTIGMTVTIPSVGPDMTPTIIPTPAPVAVTIDTPACYATADGGAWCLALAKNSLPITVENLSGWISLRTSGGEIPGATAYTPLNLLRPGEAIPLMHFFSAPLPVAYTPQIELLTALPAVMTTTRYITTSIQIGELNMEHLQADVRGQIRFDAAAPPAGLVSLAAIAYDDAGQPVGVAKWELAGDPLPASGVPFQVTVFSLGPTITRVEVMAEAIPAEAIPAEAIPVATSESTAPE